VVLGGGFRTEMQGIGSGIFLSGPEKNFREKINFRKNFLQCEKNSGLRKFPENILRKFPGKIVQR
jgi:hypothetical protein